MVRLSEFVEDGVQGSEVIHLLLPFLGRKLRRSVTIETDILVTVGNLMKNATDPKQFLM